MHGDLKPDNLVVGMPNEGRMLGKLRIIDFGIATKFLDDSGEHVKED